MVTAAERGAGVCERSGSARCCCSDDWLRVRLSRPRRRRFCDTSIAARCEMLSARLRDTDRVVVYCTASSVRRFRVFARLRGASPRSRLAAVSRFPLSRCAGLRLTSARPSCWLGARALCRRSGLQLTDWIGHRTLWLTRAQLAWQRVRPGGAQSQCIASTRMTCAAGSAIVPLAPRHRQRRNRGNHVLE